MLPAKYRLPKSEIALLLKEGKYFNFKNFTIRFKPNQEQNARVCIIVSSKVSNKAVIRNLIKRRLRSAIYLILKTFAVKLDIILIAKKNIVNKKYSEIFQELNTIFKNYLNKNF